MNDGVSLSFSIEAIQSDKIGIHLSRSKYKFSILTSSGVSPLIALTGSIKS